MTEQIQCAQPAPAKYTPGPWTAKFTSGAGLSVHADVSKAIGPRYSHDCPIYHTASNSVGLSIAYELWTQFPRAEWEAMQQANAQLIAAAPDLLAACINARDMLATDRQGFVDCHQVHGPRVDDAVAHGLVWVSEDVWIPPDVADALRDYDRAIALIDKATAKAIGAQA